MKGVDRLCFGTSTFAAGRLRPDKDSRPGIAALAAALSRGVRLIHSNPKLGTQWAIREAIEAAGRPPGIRHLIKIELPIGATAHDVVRTIDMVADASAAALGFEIFDAAVIELDLKRTVSRRALVDSAGVTAFYQAAAEAVMGTGRFGAALGYCHSPSHLAACMRAAGITGFAAQYNSVEAWPALDLDTIEHLGKPFIAMSPLRRGRLVPASSSRSPDRLRALRWALGHPGVTFVTVTISSLSHLAEILDAAELPLPIGDVHRQAEVWQTALPVAPLPAEK